MEFKSSDVNEWREALSAYESRIESLNKPNLVSLNKFYRCQLPQLILERNPNPYITTSELSNLMQWKLSRGKWSKAAIVGFCIIAVDEVVVKSASQKAFQSLPDVSKAISELTVLKGVGPATASAILAACAPDVAPFISDEAMVAALGNTKDYTLKQYLLFTEKLQAKAKELSAKGGSFTPSDAERALWSSAVGAKSVALSKDPKKDITSSKVSKRKRK